MMWLMLCAAATASAADVRALWDQGDHAAAVDAAALLADEHPEDAGAQHVAGELALAHGDIGGAVHHLARAAWMVPSSSTKRLYQKAQAARTDGMRAPAPWLRDIDPLWLNLAGIVAALLACLLVARRGQRRWLLGCMVGAAVLCVVLSCVRMWQANKPIVTVVAPCTGTDAPAGAVVLDAQPGLSGEWLDQQADMTHVQLENGVWVWLPSTSLLGAPQQ
jgi:hypothetical protein